MSRIRSIKPEFFTSAQVLECSPIARLLFVGLWCFCDDKGRHPFSAKQAKAEVFPADEDITVESVRRMLDELTANDLIRIYECSGVPLFFVTGWKHQKIDRPQAPRYGEPPEAIVSADSTIIRRVIAPDTIRSDRIGSRLLPAEAGEAHVPEEARQEKPKVNGSLFDVRTLAIAEPSPPPAEPASRYPQAFQELWDVYREHIGEKNSSKARSFGYWKRLDEKDQTDCYFGLSEYCSWANEERKKRADVKLKHLETFINGRNWEPYLEAAL